MLSLLVNKSISFVFGNKMKPFASYSAHQRTQKYFEQSTNAIKAHCHSLTIHERL